VVRVFGQQYGGRLGLKRVVSDQVLNDCFDFVPLQISAVVVFAQEAIDLMSKRCLMTSVLCAVFGDMYVACDDFWHIRLSWQSQRPR